MSENNTPTPEDRGWPDGERPGVPVNPEKGGAHWCRYLGHEQPELGLWSSILGAWITFSGSNLIPRNFAKRYEYIAPCLTPAQHAAEIAAAVRAAEAKGMQAMNDWWRCVVTQFDNETARAIFARGLDGFEQVKDFNTGEVEFFPPPKFAIRARGTTDAVERVEAGVLRKFIQAYEATGGNKSSLMHDVFLEAKTVLPTPASAERSE